MLKAISHIGDTTRHDSMRHDPFFRSPYNQMDQFTHMQHDNVLSSRQRAETTKITLEAIFVVCRSDSIKKTVKPSSHIGDTTRHDSMRHDPFFRSPYNQMDQFTHMQHDQVWSSRQKTAATKIALEAILVVCRSDSIKKTDKENSFHKFMTQE